MSCNIAKTFCMVFQPIVVKVLNAAGQDYPEGFYPDLPLIDNFLILKPLGDIDEPLLNAALSAIGVQNARLIPQSEQSASKPLFESLDQKRGNRQLIMENPNIDL